MSEKVITSDADYYLDPELGFEVSHARKTTVIVLENSASATLLFGLSSLDGTFTALADGAITDDGVINHGRGARLMVRVSGIAADSVTIGFYQA